MKKFTFLQKTLCFPKISYQQFLFLSNKFVPPIFPKNLISSIKHRLCISKAAQNCSDISLRSWIWYPPKTNSYTYRLMQLIIWAAALPNCCQHNALIEDNSTHSQSYPDTQILILPSFHIPFRNRNDVYIMDDNKNYKP